MILESPEDWTKEAKKDFDQLKSYIKNEWSIEVSSLTKNAEGEIKDELTERIAILIFSYQQNREDQAMINFKRKIHLRKTRKDKYFAQLDNALETILDLTENNFHAKDISSYVDLIRNLTEDGIKNPTLHISIRTKNAVQEHLELILDEFNVVTAPKDIKYFLESLSPKISGNTHSLL